MEIWDTNTPAPVGSTDTVCNEDQSTSVDEVRASLGEMMTVAGDSDPNTVVLDVRSSSELYGTQARTDTAFSGRIKTAVWNEWKNMTTTGSSSAPGTKIKSKGNLKEIYALSGITKRTTVYTY
ncbi:MAG: hypothetical protein L0956_10580 [Candidatus Mariimomonas ferrooxydans]